MNKVLQNNLSQIPHTPQIFSVIKQFCLIWTKFVQFPRAACSITLIAYGDVVMDPLRGEIIQNLIQNFTKLYL